MAFLPVNTFSSHTVDMSYQHIKGFGTNFASLYLLNNNKK